VLLSSLTPLLTHYRSREVIGTRKGAGGRRVRGDLGEGRICGGGAGPLRGSPRMPKVVGIGEIVAKPAFFAGKALPNQ